MFTPSTVTQRCDPDMSLVSNVVRRGAVYYFRRRVPPQIQSVIGMNLIRESLGTCEPKVARRLALRLPSSPSDEQIRLHGLGGRQNGLPDHQYDLLTEVFQDIEKFAADDIARGQRLSPTNRFRPPCVRAVADCWNKATISAPAAAPATTSKATSVIKRPRNDRNIERLLSSAVTTPRRLSGIQTQ
jgi:hypothetical protein